MSVSFISNQNYELITIVDPFTIFSLLKLKIYIHGFTHGKYSIDSPCRWVHSSCMHLKEVMVTMKGLVI